jgi:hypothetical protein
MPECFVIMPLTTPKTVLDRYSGDPDHFLHVLDHLFVPAIEAAGFTPKKPIAEGSDLILAEIVKSLQDADMVLCDISTLNANVFLELGIRTALNHPICVVRDTHTDLPFDVGGINFHRYTPDLRPWVLPEQVDRLAAHLKTTSERSAGQNALWKHFGLTQRGAAAIESAPEDAPLKLILEELQQLRQRQPTSAQQEADLFVDAAFELASVVGGRMDGATITDNGVVTLTGDFPLRSRKAIRRLAEVRRIIVKFVELSAERE